MFLGLERSRDAPRDDCTPHAADLTCGHARISRRQEGGSGPRRRRYPANGVDTPSLKPSRLLNGVRTVQKPRRHVDESHDDGATHVPYRGGLGVRSPLDGKPSPGVPGAKANGGRGDSGRPSEPRANAWTTCSTTVSVTIVSPPGQGCPKDAAGDHPISLSNAPRPTVIAQLPQKGWGISHDRYLGNFTRSVILSRISLPPWLSV